jgi:hypothetical protein
VKNTDSTKSDTLTDEVEVDFHVLGALVLNWVGGEVDDADVVAVDEDGRLQRVMQLLEKLLQPGSFSNAIWNSPILGFRAGPGDGRLPLR